MSNSLSNSLAIAKLQREAKMGREKREKELLEQQAMVAEKVIRDLIAQYDKSLASRKSIYKMLAENMMFEGVEFDDE